MMYKHVNTVYFPHPAALRWWYVCKGCQLWLKKCKILMSLLLGMHNLGCCIGRHVHKTRTCQLCDSYVEETIPHFLLECNALHKSRIELFALLFNVMPPAMIDSFRNMTPRRKTRFLLCNLERTNVDEWDGILVRIIEIVYGLYLQRTHLLKAIM